MLDQNEKTNEKICTMKRPYSTHLSYEKTIARLSSLLKDFSSTLTRKLESAIAPKLESQYSPPPPRLDFLSLFISWGLGLGSNNYIIVPLSIDMQPPMQAWTEQM